MGMEPCFRALRREVAQRSASDSRAFQPAGDNTISSSTDTRGPRTVSSKERTIDMKCISQCLVLHRYNDTTYYSPFTAIILNITYGKRTEDNDDELLSLSQTAVEALAHSQIPGAF